MSECYLVVSELRGLLKNGLSPQTRTKKAGILPIVLSMRQRSECAIDYTELKTICREKPLHFFSGIISEPKLHMHRRKIVGNGYTFQAVSKQPQ